MSAAIARQFSFRRITTTVAAYLFVLALLLAASAPFAIAPTPRASTLPKEQLLVSYDLGSKGAFKATARAVGLLPGTPLLLQLREAPDGPVVAEARGYAEANGDASVSFSTEGLPSMTAHALFTCILDVRGCRDAQTMAIKKRADSPRS